MNKIEQLRKEILEKVEMYYNAVEDEKESFIPGKTRVSFAGRVYDEKEMVNLVDSSLDFWLTAGRYADEFERRFATKMQQKYCALVNSGSSANLVAFSALTSPKLKAKQLKPGDEVITVAAGFPTTVNPIVQYGLIPVFVDIEITTCNIDTSYLEEALSDKTRAVMLAHTLGNPFDLETVSAFCRKHNLFLIEDCCDAVGSTYNGKMVGTYGDLATVSFYPAHHITMGEGGAVLTKSGSLHRNVLSFRDWGRDCFCGPGSDNTCGHRFDFQFGTLPPGYDHKYVYSHIGYNLKVSDMQASVGVAQLDKLDSFIESRKQNFKILKNHLQQYSSYLILPEATPNSDPSWFGFMFSIVENEHFSRLDIVEHLEDEGILTRQLFAGNLTRQPAYEDVNYRIVRELKNTDYVMKNGIFIGVYPGIDSERMDHMKSSFNRFFQKKGLA
ncbi:lipopolysaccharide biosynthesis protein RfbH [Halosquirtibacter xylanolyticus]|uniref:lipopolysaccharide biosynthesis protein RfbH n=1 Tax=Halosquirtibacter xylanolyticus TaxID=3374599 RepID=UPI003748A9DC|nr:lipopolysaccharide biosynthesis protein RfbH [Prolixibacteraceae bacterium]